jgi:hypothetical protein
MVNVIKMFLSLFYLKTSKVVNDGEVLVTNNIGFKNIRNLRITFHPKKQITTKRILYFFNKVETLDFYYIEIKVVLNDGSSDSQVTVINRSSKDILMKKLYSVIK